MPVYLNYLQYARHEYGLSAGLDWIGWNWAEVDYFWNYPNF